ncbi:MAG: heavy metal translocating P-type ATPase [Bacteroidota bacterium]
MSNIKLNIKVSGMSCASCSMSVQTILEHIPGVKSAFVNLAMNTVLIHYDDEKTSLFEMKKELKKAEFDLILNDEYQTVEKLRLKKLKYRLYVSIVFSLPIFVLSMFFMHSIENLHSILLVLSIPVIFFSGKDFYIAAYKKAKQLSANMDTLVALSTGIAFVYSAFNTLFPYAFEGMGTEVYFESSTVIITLIIVGKFLEERAKSNASAAIKKLISIQTKTISVTRKDTQIEIGISEVKKNDVVQVKPGDIIPVDGIILSGISSIDESSISGEPIPKDKSEGDKVFSGTINQNGVLIIKATTAGSNTVLSQIIEQIESSQYSRPPIQKLVDKVSSWFVPTVLVLSIITFCLWYIFGPEPVLHYSMLTAISVLIIACPCALGLATPTALTVGIGKGAENGILIKDAQSLELANKINIIAMDKTGTLTEGIPSITRGEFLSHTNSDFYAAIIFSIENKSSHPIAKALTQYLSLNYTDIPEITVIQNIPGMGTVADFNNAKYLIGNLKLMMANNIQVPSEIIDNEINDSTKVYFAENQSLIAYFEIEDILKLESISAINSLKKLGIEIVMLTGDSENSAAKIAKKLGINRYFAGILPTEKVDYIKQLQMNNNVVAMVGDGINDAAAMSQANLSFAMATGADIAKESAGITLLRSNITDVYKSIILSRYILKIIKQNLFWAFAYNVLSIPIAAGVLFASTGLLLSPMIAGAAMAMSSVSVVSNSLRIKNLNMKPIS